VLYCNLFYARFGKINNSNNDNNNNDDKTMLQISGMASSDLDPVFVTALKLLQSRSKDSYFQLRQMYDEVVAQRKAEAAIKRVLFHFWLAC